MSNKNNDYDNENIGGNGRCLNDKDEGDKEQ